MDFLNVIGSCRGNNTDNDKLIVEYISDYMWNAIKDPLETPLAFDSDGLNLAFKYFTSTTLTMRLAGISQINNHIGLLAELCVGEGISESEGAPRNMADWLQNNNIISHIFGPNLHVEVSDFVCGAEHSDHLNIRERNTYNNCFRL